jgi:hypothetical protein
MKKEMNNALKKLIDRLEKTEQFVLDQAPDICKEMVKEKVFDNTVDLFFNGLLTLILTGYASFAAIHLYRLPEISMDQGMGFGISGALSAIGVIPALYEFINTLKYIYFVKNCTKLFLLRQFKDLIP